MSMTNRCGKDSLISIVLTLDFVVVSMGFELLLRFSAVYRYEAAAARTRTTND
jgi:hypothetical protein